jgi:protein-tyrosine phosphatase
MSLVEHRAVSGTVTAPPRFDAGPGARPLLKERLLWAAVMGLFFFLAYGSANGIAALTAPHPALLMEWERAIPFLPAFILPYMSSDILFVAAFLAANSRDGLQRLALRCGLATILSVAIFIAVPLQVGFERPVVEGWPAPLFGLLGLDRPYNQFPSLHISLGIVAWHALDRCLTGIARLLLALWFLAIGVSTLLVWQHHFIDLPGGLAVAALVFRLLPEAGRTRIPLGFVTPRHLDMALRYLVLAVPASGMAFASPLLALPLGWLALSLTGVAMAYGLGLNTFLAKRRGGYHAMTWIVFWPWLAASWLNWRWWHGRIAPRAELEPGLWFGARPAPEDWESLRRAGIESVIDLAPELPSRPPAGMAYDHLPLLDIAIPAPAALDEIARRIDERRGRGGVYVHCALGMSRSAMAIAACMMRRGMTADRALSAIDRVRPERVRRPYIRIALRLYEDWLAAR